MRKCSLKQRFKRERTEASGATNDLKSPLTDPNWRDRLSIGAKRMVLTFQVVQFENRTFKAKTNCN